ncbi:YwqJ-related putative deaminase [Yinghuangia seranimata]|uniref:YwqJ-related putative deaminase n=1 Tax=Yinghuangia seranimata TaxID=408067 RepID=UPI00248B692C|nr:YwqJ-related putative deaminase [Yinghuangia seranimata]MDI2126746.1 YwqJ-related putative deaminase [Yinghuangia seranimata]
MPPPHPTLSREPQETTTHPELITARVPRDSILPAVAAALFVGKQVRTLAGAKGDAVPPAHPLVREALAALAPEQRERWDGRCPEVALLSAHLVETEAARKGRTAKKVFTLADARRALKGARVTVRRIREEGDPADGGYQPPCRSCAALFTHFGVTATEG